MSDFLVLSGMGASPYSLRGVSQTLTPIEAATQIRRTVNGALVDISSTQFRKYQSTIKSGDQLPPAFDGIWPGALLTVDCISELSYPYGGSPEREPVDTGATRQEGEFMFYRPRLDMMVVSFDFDTDEYGARVSWTLQLEEV